MQRGAATPTARRTRPKGARWLRSVRRRPIAAVSLMGLSALAVLVSVLTPMLLRSSEAVVLAQTAAAAGVDAGVVATSQTAEKDDVQVARDAVAQAMAALRTPGAWTPATTVTATVDAGRWVVPTEPENVRHTGFITLAPEKCRGLTITAGRCPANAGQVLLPASVQRRVHARLGSTIVLRFLIRVLPPSPVVVGVYDDSVGEGRLLAAPDSLTGDRVVEPDAALVTVQTREAELIGYPFQTVAVRRLTVPARIDLIPEIRRDIGAASRSVLGTDGAAASARVDSGLPALLDAFATAQSAATLLTAAIALQAVALAWFALAAVIGRISRVRAPEWGIGRTRAVPFRTWLGIVFLEPGLAIVAGAVLGAGLGAGVAALAARVALGPDAEAEPFTPVVGGAALLTLIGSLAALVVASLRSARLPLPALLRESTEPRRLSRPALVAQAGIAVVAAVVVAQILTERQQGPVALLAPTVIALLIALAALRATVAVVRSSTRRPSRSLGGLVVGRQIARAPSVLTVAVLVAIGFGLAAYALQLAVVAQRLGAARAEAEVGATTVLRVSVPQGRDILSLVRSADPSGRAAMAARELAPSGASDTSRIIAVDTPRLNAVSTWRPEWRGAASPRLLRLLDPSLPQDLVLRGTWLQLAVREVLDAHVVPPPHLLVVVALPDRTWRTIDLGAFRDGTMGAAIPCSSGCRVVELGADIGSNDPWNASLLITGMRTDRQPASAFTSWLHTPGRWRDRVIDAVDATLPAAASPLSGPAGLGIEFGDAQGGNVSAVEPGLGPVGLPAEAAAGTQVSDFAGFQGIVAGTDLGGHPLLMQIVARSAVIPRLLGNGVLVDLGWAERLADQAQSTAVDEVWLAPGDHAAVLARLRAEGVRIVRTERLSTAVAAEQRSAPVRALWLALVTAGAALLLTVLALLASRIASSSSLERDRRVLRAAGVGPARLRRLAFVDVSAPPIVGAVIGVLSAVVAYAITAGGLPLAPPGANPPADLVPPVLLLLVLGAVGGVALALLGAAVAALEVRRDRP